MTTRTPTTRREARARRTGYPRHAASTAHAQRWVHLKYLALVLGGLASVITATATLITAISGLS